MDLKSFKNKWIEKVAFSNIDGKTKDELIIKLIRLNKERLPSFIKYLTKLVMTTKQNIVKQMLNEIVDVVGE